MTTLRQHLTFANVASASALVVALAGSGVAVAAALPPDSVGTAQIRNGSVKPADLGTSAVVGAKIAPNAVAGSKVAPDSLTGADVKESTLKLPAGPRVFASGPTNSGVKLTTSPAVYATVPVVAPAAGFLVVTGEATLNSGEAGTWIGAVIAVDGVDTGGTYWDAGDVDANFDQVQSSSVTLPISAGAHTVALRLQEGSVMTTYSSVYLPQVTAEYFPAGKVVSPPAIPDRSAR